MTDPVLTPEEIRRLERIEDTNSTQGLTAIVDGMVREHMAQAWSRGMNYGSSRAMRHMSDEPSLPLASEADNPY